MKYRAVSFCVEQCREVHQSVVYCCIEYQCTVYSVQCTVYSVQFTVYSVQCTVCSVQLTVYTLHCTVCSLQCVLPTDIYVRAGLWDIRVDIY